MTTTSRLKLNPQLGRMPTLQFCRPEELRIDPSYQRDIANGSSQALIRKIAQHWNWDLCQPLVVARRVDFIERLFVIDGQHRLEAAKLRGDINQLPCVILSYSSQADEAASFVHLNQQRRPLNKLELFKASVASEDVTSCAIVTAMAEAGLSIAPNTNYTTWAPGAVSNIGGIEQAWRKHGPEITIRSMKALADGFEGERLQYAGTLFPGIVAVCALEMYDGRAFEGARFKLFTNMLGLKQQVEWRSAITKAKGDNPHLKFAAASARVFLDAWTRADTAPVQRELAAPAPRVAAAPAAPKAAIRMDALAPRWCDQCEQRVSAQKVAACHSQFCKAKEAA